MLKRMCAEQCEEWDRYIGPLLFAYRETPQDYVRTVMVSLRILDNGGTKTTYQHVFDFKQWIEETCKLA